MPRLGEEAPASPGNRRSSQTGRHAAQPGTASVVSIQPLTPELATSFGLREAKRVLISDVVQDSHAEKAGITAGEIITDFGHPLLDLVAAQEQRVGEEGRERRTRRRYLVWGDVPG